MNSELTAEKLFMYLSLWQATTKYHQDFTKARETSREGCLIVKKGVMKNFMCLELAKNSGIFDLERQ